MGSAYLPQDLVRLVETEKEKAAETLASLGGVEGIAAALNSSLEFGLDGTNTQDLEARVARYGRNYVEPEKPLTIFQLMWQAFQDTTIIVLTVAGVLSFILGVVPFPKREGDTTPDESTGNWIEGVSIMFAVLIVVFVTALNDYQKEKQFRALNAVKEDEKIKVIRNGVPGEVSKFNLVVGDVVRIDLGDIIPADGLVFDENDLKLDESAMTGESVLLKKNRRTAPFLLSGTKAMEGVGKMLVICVGENSQAGIITKLIMNKKESKPKKEEEHAEDAGDNYLSVVTPKEGSSAVKEDKSKSDDDDEEEIVSPLQGKLDRLTMLIVKIGVFTAVVVLIALVIRYSIRQFVTKKLPWENVYLQDYLSMIILAVTILVVAIPEGLPLAVTIALAFSVKKMLKDNNLVRHLGACETMGSATTICSDKTGTLTTNRMTVVECYIGGTEFSTSQAVLDQVSASARDVLCTSIAVNSTAEILPPKQAGAQPEHTGNKTECALLQFASNMGVEYAPIRKSASICHMITFSSAKKRMSVVVPLSHYKVRVFTKGASEIVLALCTSKLNLDGSVSAFSTTEQSAVNADIIDKYANQAYRTLCLAYRDVDVSPEAIKDWSDDDIEKDLTCIAIVGIEDPVRDEVPGAIRQCNEAGIVVRMVTGDNIATARSIAYKCGILNRNDGSLVMEGKEFRQRVLDNNGNIIQDEFDKIWPMLRVLARSSPKDKYTLVSGILQSNLVPHGPQVVAVTGDGTNDAPALKRADVGFAMGICGTAVAKDASDIILMDDNFKSIVNAVKWGRNVYDSVAKFLQFQLTVNVVAITIAVIGAIVLEESPLTAIQLLWVNLIMDTFASLALATDLPTNALLTRKPYPRTKALISRRMTKHIFGQAALQLIVLLVLIFEGHEILGVSNGQKRARPESEAHEPSVHYTVVFNAFVMMQLFNEINARRIHDEINVFENIFQNKLYWAVMAIQIVMQICIIQFGGKAFGCTPLNLWQWAVCIGLGFLALPVGLILRLLRGKNLPKFFASCKEDAIASVKHTPRGQELWQRGFKRLRTQIRVINAFKRSLSATKRPLALA